MLLNPTQPLDAQLCSITGISGSHQEIFIANPFAIKILHIVSLPCTTCHSLSVGPSASKRVIVIQGEGFQVLDLAKSRKKLHPYYISKNPEYYIISKLSH